MAEKWMVARGALEDGSQFVVLADAAYASKSLRENRETLLAVNFPGTYMIQATERRDAFLDGMTAFLLAHDGVHVAGITRAGKSYTFLFYLGRRAERADVPIPAECADIARIWFAHDPKWMEYSSFMPSRPGLFERLKAWFTPARPMIVGPHALAGGSDGNDDERVLQALAAAGSDLSKSTDIVFYLYIPERDDAERCYTELWEHGYRARVSTPLGELPSGASEHRWSVISNLEAVPTPATILASRELMEHLAQKFGGDYDGWEAAVAR